MLAEHQRTGVSRVLELLESRGGAILADEAGMGKSFVAAEVIRRAGADTEIIVPAALLSQWQDTLEQFSVRARLFTHDGIVGASLERRRERRLVIVDEAHAFRNPATRRYSALCNRTVGARLLLVTATPLCNSLADLEALLRLFARDDILMDQRVPSIDAAFERKDRMTIERIVSALVIRRVRSVLPPSLQFGELRRSVVRHPVPDLPQISQLSFPLIGEQPLLRRFLRRRLESSEAALIESVSRQLRFYARVRSAMAAGRVLPKREYRRAFSDQEERDQFQEVLFWELFAPAGEVDPRQIERETRLLESLREALRDSPCTKRRLLTGIVASESEPMLIFTGSAATARDLHAVLHRLRPCGLITSRERTRDAVLQAFISGKLDVIISTDATAEGLNLQRAGVVVHYDIPWNPVRLDQRNGRAFRIGQTRSEVRAIYFLPQTRDTRILETVSRKNRLRRQTLDQPRFAMPPWNDRATLRPRLTPRAAFAELSALCPAPLPEGLARRHKAGIERLIEQRVRNGCDIRQVEELAELVAREA